MPSKNRSKQAMTSASLPILRADAAGVDIGETEIYAAVSHDRSDQPVRSFGTFTENLRDLADWFTQCQVKTVAMEATGVYWIPLYEVLEARGFEVYLVNARHVKNVPGRKSDVSDCQWIQFLHAVGLLRASFRPSQEVCAIRGYMRHRNGLIRDASRYVLRLQKALTQMNLQLHNVINDITGKTGAAIIEAILAGERNPAALAKLRDRRTKNGEEIIAKSLVGNWRHEHLFALQQCWAAYKHMQTMIAECDQEIDRLLHEFDSPNDTVDTDSTPAQMNHAHKSKAAVSKMLALRAQMLRLFGIDLVMIPGFGIDTVVRLFCEIGPDLSRFPTAKHFASWLGLCPDKRTSAGKVQSSKTRKVKSLIAQLFRMAAASLHHSDSELGVYLRRMKAKLGKPEGITATAHRLARIVYHLITTRTEYDEAVQRKDDKIRQQRRLNYLAREAAKFGLQLTTLADTDPIMAAV